MESDGATCFHLPSAERLGGQTGECTQGAGQRSTCKVARYADRAGGPVGRRGWATVFFVSIHLWRQFQFCALEDGVTGGARRATPGGSTSTRGSGYPGVPGRRGGPHGRGGYGYLLIFGF